MAEMNRLEPGTTRYIFFDEIQYLKEWERHLKSLVDSYPSYRFIATGSAAALRLKSQESGAGRFTDFMLPPLTFGEYIHFIGKEGLVEADPDSEKGFRQEDPSRFIKSDVIDKVLLRDLPSLYGISDIQELNSLFATLYNTAQEVEIGKLSQNSGVVANTLARYLEYLEAAFLIKRIRRVDESAKQFKRARGFKVYLTNPSIRAALYGPVTADHEAVGALAETAIYAQWIHATAVIERLYFARWKKGLEVDVVGLDLGQRKADWVVEVKWSDRFFEHPADLKGVLAFAAANRLSRPPLTITRTCQGSKRGDGIELRFVPTSIHCYTIGRNVLRRVVAKF